MSRPCLRTLGVEGEGGIDHIVALLQHQRLELVAGVLQVTLQNLVGKIFVKPIKSLALTVW